MLLCCVRCDGERSPVVLKLAVPDDDDGVTGRGDDDTTQEEKS